MNRRIYRNRREPKRTGLSWDERWKGADRGLITCWETGRELAQSDPQIAGRAKHDELPALDWKGGVEKKLKKNPNTARSSIWRSGKAYAVKIWISIFLVNVKLFVRKRE